MPNVAIAGSNCYHFGFLNANIMYFENVVQLIKDEIDSLKDAYKKESQIEKKIIYSTRILECKKAIKVLLSQSLY